MVQSALDLQVWKEIAISKQLLIKTATDALGIPAECSEQELKDALEKGIKEIGEAETKIISVQSASAKSIATIEDRLRASERGRVEVDDSNTALADQKKALEKLIDSERKLHNKELTKVKTDLEKKVKQLKTINVTLADTPENVAKKLKVLNKKKFDESTARKRAEEDARSLKKEKQELQKKVKAHEESLKQAEELVEMYRELRSFSDEQYTELKGLVEDDVEMKALPEQDKLLLEALEDKTKDEDED